MSVVVKSDPDLKPTISTKSSSPPRITDGNEARKSVNAFYDLARNCTVSKAYERNGTSLHKYTTDQLFLPCKAAFMQAASTRNAVMHFMSVVTHESVCIHINKSESSNKNAADPTSLNEALHKFLVLLKQSIASHPTFWCPVVFKWCVDVLCDVSQRNKGVAFVKGKTLADFITFFSRSVNVTAQLCKLMSQCVSYLIDHNSNECISVLIECVRTSGQAFDWVLSFIGSSFPSTIIVLLLKAGIENFSAHMEEMTPGKYSASRTQAQSQILRDAYQAKLRSLGDILSQMAKHRSHELKLECCNILQDGSKVDAKRDAFIKVAFLFFLSSISKDILLITLHDAAEFVTPECVVRVSAGLNKLPLQAILGAQQLPDIILQMLLTPDQKHVTKAFEIMRILAFVQNIPRIDSVSLAPVKFHANHILGVFLQNISRQVHGQPNFKNSDLPLLNIVDENLVQNIISLKLGKYSSKSYTFKLLVYLALAKGQDKSVEIMSLLFFTANGESELCGFVAMNRVLRPFFAKLLHDFVERFTTLKQLAKEAIKNFDALLECTETQIVENLIYLIRFQNSNESSICPENQQQIVDEPKMFFELLEPIQFNYGDFLMPLLALCNVEDLQITWRVFDLVKLIGRPVHLIPKHVLLIIHAAIEIYFELLTSCDSEMCDNCLKDCGDLAIGFTMCQHEFAQHSFWKALIESLFRHHDELLCSPSTHRIGAETSNEKLLDANRKRCIEKPNKLIHSGRINKFVKKHDSHSSGVSATRYMKVMEFIDVSCQKNRGGNSFFYENGVTNTQTTQIQYDLESCRMLASIYTQLMCDRDAIASLFEWEDWSCAKMTPCVEKYLSVCKRVDDLRFGWDILFFLAESNPCVWFCMPVFKSILASSLAQTQSNANKTAAVNANILQRLDKWFTILTKAQILPRPLDYLYDVLCLVSNLDASVILLAIWDYVKSIHVTSKIVRSHFEMMNLQVEDVPTIKGQIDTCLQECHCVMQSNIDKVGYLFPKLYQIP